jgi:hypothetical protein
MLKPIPDFPGYFASDDGEIYSMRPLKRFCKPPEIPRKLKKHFNRKHKSPYYMVRLQKDGKPYQRKVCRLILEAFISPRPQGKQCCHGKMGRFIDSVGNLSWKTPKENNADKYRDGTQQTGENNPAHKFNELQVRIIRKAYGVRGKNGLSSPVLAKIFNVNVFAIYAIIHRMSWKHI